MRVSGIYSMDDTLSTHMTTPATATVTPPPLSNEPDSIFVKH
jgi:hypothetical protein